MSMNPYAVLRPHADEPTETTEPTRLRGWRLAIVRALVFPLAALALIVYAVALPGLPSRLATPCDDIPNTCLFTPEQMTQFARLSITPSGLAVAVTALTCLAILLVVLVAAVLLVRRSDDRMALFVALTLLLMPAVYTPIIQGLTAGWWLPGQLMNLFGLFAIYLLMGLFPSGRFVPRWIWAPIVILILCTGIPLGNALAVLAIFLILALYGCIIAAQLYRYRRLASPVQRAQTRWVVFGFILALAVNLVFWQPVAWIPALQRPTSLYTAFAALDSFLILCILAGSFGVSILRYRLYDIDVIIRRTLIYGSLTVILATVYLAGVVGVQSVVNEIARKSSGATSPVLIVITTLLIAALFQPLRHRIQRFIDRRFYRSRYDIRKTLDSFGMALRQEVDLSALTGQLVEVVHETMQPEHVSLWLRENESAR
jgi:hypothetical protein